MVTNTSNKSETAELVIFGAGIAGCAAAQALLEKGTNVLLLHGGEDACGTESLSGDACSQVPSPILESGAPLTQLVAWWGSEFPTSISVSGGLIMQRDVLAREFRRYVSGLGCRLVRIQKLLLLRRENRTWDVKVRDAEGTILDIRTPLLVDATGRNAAVAS